MKIFEHQPKVKVTTRAYCQSILRNQATLIKELKYQHPETLKQLILVELESDNPREGHLRRIISRLATLEKKISWEKIEKCLSEKRKRK